MILYCGCHIGLVFYGFHVGFHIGFLWFYNMILCRFVWFDVVSVNLKNSNPENTPFDHWFMMFITHEPIGRSWFQSLTVKQLTPDCYARSESSLMHS